MTNSLTTSKIALTILCLLLVGLNGYLWNANANLAKKFQTETGQALWFRSALASGSASRQPPATTSPHGTLTIMKALESEVKRASMEKLLTRMEQQDKQRVQIFFKEIDFNRFLKWLNQVYQSTGLQPDQVYIQQNSAKDSVQAKAIFF